MEETEIRQRSIRSQDQNEEDRESIAPSEASTETASTAVDDIESQAVNQRPRRKRRPAEIKARDNVNSLISVIVFIGISLLFVKYMDGNLPSPKTIREHDPNGESTSFIEERARSDLHRLISPGVRVSGSSATDLQTVDIFKDILDQIILEASPAQHVTYDIQRPSGEFFLDDDEGHISTYAEVSNVIAKLEPADPELQSNVSSILLNCHFDTKPGSPGATDNMISCATMLEVLRIMSRSFPFRNTILFLFNGAEELGLQGAHGFVAGRDSLDPESEEIGHRWSKNLKTFMNLEGAGAGGREILFQTGPGNGWVLKAYAGVTKHPYGLVIAEEAFQQGLIPSDTDYRIFRDFAKIPGLDMAFIKNGWVYHTKWDKLIEIPAGSIQHMGDNALALAKDFGNLDFTAVEESDGKMIFFDVFGMFMIYYTETVGIIINCLVAVVAIGLVCLEVFVLEGDVVLTTFKIQRLPKGKPMLEKLLWLIWLPVSTLLAWGTGILAAYVVALIFNWTGYNKPFYTYPTMSFVIFGVPAVLAQAIVYAFAHKGSEGRTWLAGKVTIAVVTLAMTFVTRITYVFMIIMVFGFLGRYAARYGSRVSPLRNKAIQRLWIYLILGELIPFTLACYLTLTLADVFVPILGRGGTETNPNVFFGIIVAGIISIIAFGGLVSVLAAYSKPILIASLCFSMIIVNPLLVFGFVGKIPFQEKTPMRIQLVDVERIWYDRAQNPVKNDSGYWFWTVDPNTMDTLKTIAETVTEVHDAREVDANYEHCEDIYCALPFLWPTTSSIKKSPWIPKDDRLPPNIVNRVQMEIIENIPITPSGRRITFAFNGPTQLTVVIAPGPNFRLDNWSFAGVQSEIPPANNGFKWQGRPTYFIYHGKGYTAGEFLVTCDFVGENPVGVDLPVLDLMFTGSFLYGVEMMTPKFTDFANRFPSWTNVMAWTSVVKIYPIY